MTEQQVAQNMQAKGYTYILLEKNDLMDPMYAKTLMDIGPLYREFPHRLFVVKTIEEFLAE